eukprot:1238597-Amphidinium_carterae.2
MEIKTAYKQNTKEAMLDKQDYKQKHFHDYSVKLMITEIYQQFDKKPGAQHNHQGNTDFCDS